MENYYKKYNFPASSTFLKQLKIEKIKTTTQEIEEFIGNRVEQHQTVINNERKRTLGKIVSFRPLSLVQMDIYVMFKYKKHNKGYKYILCMIDVFTRYVDCVMIKSKKFGDCIDALKIMLNFNKIK